MTDAMVSSGAGFLPDAVNYLVLLLTISFFLYRGTIRSSIALVLALGALVPFFLNDFLFPASYMPDQFVYTRGVAAIRAEGFDAVVGNNTGWASRILALLPIPFVESVRSLGFANKLIYTLLTIWLVNRYTLSGWVIGFLLFYPSLVMYTGLSLRDTLIMTFMILSVVSAIEGRRVLAFGLLVPLAAIKFQNAVILLVVLAMHLFLRMQSGRLKMRWLLLAFLVGLAWFFALLALYIDELNLYRIAMVVEDGGRPTDVTPITGGSDLAIAGISNSLLFLVKPFPWDAENALQLVQSVENIGVAAFLGWLTWRCASIDRARTAFWVASLFFAFAVYGLVVANFGTAARYRFPFVVLYVVALTIDIGLVRPARPRRPARTASNRAEVPAA